MARLIPPGELTVNIYVGPDGRQCRKSDPGARLKEWVSRKYYVAFRKPGSRNETRRAAFTDRKRSEQLRQDIERDIERGGEGEPDPYRKHLVRPVMEHLSEYLAQFQLD